MLTVNADVVKLLQDTAKRAEVLALAPTVPMPSGPYLVRTADGTLAERDAFVPRPEYRDYRAVSLQGLMEAIRDIPGLAGSSQTPKLGELEIATGAKPVVMVGDDSVIGYFDEPTRREAIIFEFELSEAMTRVEREFKDERGQDMAPPDLVWVLRSEFDYGIAPDDTLAVLRTMKFKRNNEAATSTAATRESMGRTIENEVIFGGDATLAETITVKCPVFANVPEISSLASIRCSTRLKYAEGAVQIKPDKVSVAAAKSEAREAAVKFLRSSLGEDAVVIDGAEPRDGE